MFFLFDYRYYYEYIFLILLLLRILVRPTDSVVAVLVVAVPYLGGDSPGPAERSTITYLFFVLILRAKTGPNYYIV